MPSLLLLVLVASSLFLETVVSAPQESPGTAQPLISAASASLGGPQNTAASTCGGCVVVAEVVGVVWYSQIFEYTAATAFVNVGVGNTTGRVISTSIVENTNVFTFRPGATGTDTNLVLTPVTYDSTAKVQGAILSYPTAYNVFTAYAINSEMSLPGGGCSTIYSSTQPVSPAYSEKIDDSSGVVTLDAKGEQQFITDVLHLSCRGGPPNIGSPMALVPITSTTVLTTQYQTTVSRAYQSSLSLAPTSTSYVTAKPGTTTLTSVVSTRTASLNATALAETAESAVTSASEAGSESSATSASEAGSESGFEPTTTTYPLATAPNIIIGSLTITPPRNPVDLSLYPTTSIGSGSTGVIVIVPTGTGSGAGNYTAIVPFLSEAGSWRRGHFWTSLWAATLSGLGLMMLWL